MANFVQLDDDFGSMIINVDAISWVEVKTGSDGPTAFLHGLGLGKDLLQIHGDRDVEKLLQAIRTDSKT